MKALTYLDFMANKKLALVSLVFPIYLAFAGKYYVIAPVCIYMAAVLTATSYFKDCKFKTQKFFFSLPVTRKDYIYSKLVYALALGAFSGLICGGNLLLKGNFSGEDLALNFLGLPLLSLVLSAFELVFLIKFGEDRGRIVMGGVIFVFFVSVDLIKKQINGELGFLKNLSQMQGPFFTLGLLVLGFLLLALLLRINLSLVKKEEY